MPLYEYRCAKCDVVIEKIQKFSDAPLEVHEGCGGKLERLLGRPALQFKGSGFYITDYKKSGSSSPSSNGKPAATKPKPKKDAPAAASTSPKKD